MGIFEDITGLHDEKHFVPKSNNEPNKKKIITSESVFIKQIDVIIRKLDEVKTKMMDKDTSMYLSYYTDLQRLEQEFVTVLKKNEEEMRFMDLSETFIRRIDKTKATLRTVKKI
ncbi:MAG: hypothetical protein ABIF40_04440 [archaeon]